MKLKMSNKRVWDDNPILKKRKSLHIPAPERTHHQLDQIIRWVFYFVDPVDSPHSTEIDFDFKKEQSLASAEVTDKEVIEAVKCFGRKRHKFSDWISVIIADYMSVTNVTKYNLWLSLKKAFSEVQFLLMNEINDDDRYRSAMNKMKMIGVSSINELGNQLSNLESELFSLQEVNDILSDKADDGLGWWAELIADPAPQ